MCKPSEASPADLASHTWQPQRLLRINPSCLWPLGCSAEQAVSPSMHTCLQRQLQDRSLWLMSKAPMACFAAQAAMLSGQLACVTAHTH